MNGLRFFLIIFASALISGLFPSQSKAGSTVNLSKILDEHRAALVTVKFVLSLDMGSARGARESEAEQEQTCTMVSGDGLVLCSNSQANGFVSTMTGMNGSNMSSSLRNFEVLFVETNESYGAEIVAVDTELDLLWIKITDAGDATFPHIDFDHHSSVKLGDDAVLIRRLVSSFGSAPVVKLGRIAGITEKPRELYILDIAMESGAGLPVFAHGGGVIGLMVTQMPEPVNNQAGLSTMMGQVRRMQDAMHGQVLPAAEVVKATQRAMETLVSE